MAEPLVDPNQRIPHSTASSVAFLGPEGTFSHVAVTDIYPHANLMPQPTITRIFEAVHMSECEFGVVPYENRYVNFWNAFRDIF